LETKVYESWKPSSRSSHQTCLDGLTGAWHPHRPQSLEGDPTSDDVLTELSMTSPKGSHTRGNEWRYEKKIARSLQPTAVHTRERSHTLDHESTCPLAAPTVASLESLRTQRHSGTCRSRRCCGISHRCCIVSITPPPAPPPVHHQLHHTPAMTIQHPHVALHLSHQASASTIHLPHHLPSTAGPSSDVHTTA